MQVGTQVKTLLSIIDSVKDNRHTCRIGIGNIIETILQFTYVIGMCISCTHSHACGKLWEISTIVACKLHAVECTQTLIPSGEVSHFHCSTGGGHDVMLHCTHALLKINYWHYLEQSTHQSTSNKGPNLLNVLFFCKQLSMAGSGGTHHYSNIISLGNVGVAG